MSQGARNQEPRVTTAVRLSESLHARLLEAATERDVSINLLVSRAVDDFLGRLVPVDELVRTRSAPTPTTQS
ncbi:MAG: toxin-antitoxin system HicB family antitoxin [Acidimicrobiaceae bacterium]|nr:toxin-antitoxin system HicB family antitoxin [Acidimicrobiaceae bacterium]MXZ64388.1 toxin-antitoxin system HicB family antitoxin [Acidimicrobiaceae bacterium]MYF33855.1 toxin-antitoxin system HicB family antitoxin [Acidimicrobiaceae bacterium]MYG76799.1 toxin-antitoxin system HicB family antitoxin [Acidimicrobiaceae bacterium]MYJ84156.1 toxin-antitoxin system HicB family antitoxin [Acidimicrobiaceae bacterium]